MPPLCDTFGRLAERTWRYLAAARATAVQIGEETLTDIDLIDLQGRHPTSVLTEKFPKHQEP